MKNRLVALFIFSSLILAAQNWSVRISSNVELRTWKLTYKAEKKEEPLGGANIVLSKDGTTISQTTSNGSGDFTVMVPGNGVYILTVSYPGCNTKKFGIITTGVPEELQKDNFYPSFSIGGFVMAKPFPGIDYSGLQQPLVKVVYSPKIKNFDDEESYTDAGLGIVGKIWEAEQTLINKFCSTNKAGDAALAKPDCPLAKKLYNEAIILIPGEPYPVEQLAKVGDCLKSAEEKKKAREEAAKKAEAEKLAKTEAAKEKTAAGKKTKADPGKPAKEKAAAEKTTKTKEVKKQTPSQSETPVKKPIEKKEETVTDKMPEAESGDAVAGNGEGDHRIPQVLGANKYKEQLNKAEGYFKMKRWTEAKGAYNELLKIRPGDPHASKRLAEIGKLSAPR